MTKARRRKVHEGGQSGSVPRDDGFTFDPGDDEFNSSIHGDEDAETKKPNSKECEYYGRGADYSLNLRLSTGNYNFVGCSVSMSEHFHPVSRALKPDYFP